MTTSPATDKAELAPPGSDPRWMAGQGLDRLAFGLTMAIGIVQTMVLPLTTQPPPGGPPPVVVAGISLAAGVWVARRASDFVTMALAEFRLSGAKAQLVRSAVLVVLTWAVFNQGRYSVPLRSAVGVCLVAVAAAAVLTGLATAAHRREAAGAQA